MNLEQLWLPAQGLHTTKPVKSVRVQGRAAGTATSNKELWVFGLQSDRLLALHYIGQHYMCL